MVEEEVRILPLLNYAAVAELAIAPACYAGPLTGFQVRILAAASMSNDEETKREVWHSFACAQRSTPGDVTIEDVCDCDEKFGDEE